MGEAGVSDYGAHTCIHIIADMTASGHPDKQLLFPLQRGQARKKAVAETQLFCLDTTKTEPLKSAML